MALLQRNRISAEKPLIDQNPPAIETALFALGSFWGPDSQFGGIPGIVRTRVGYAGGTTVNPTYRNIGDHAETIQIDFDPTVMTYEELLVTFWASHNPIRPKLRRQYMSAILYQDVAQRDAAIASKEAESIRRDGTIHTEIAQAGPFYRAEDYHQKYFLRSQRQLEQVFETIYPDLIAFTDSTAVTRVNGYVGGYGSAKQLEQEIAMLGLSPEHQDTLRSLYSRYH